MMTVHEKYQALKEYLQSFDDMAVAFSGGVDSTLLLTAAVEALGADRVLAVTAASLFFPLREKDESVAFCEQLGVRQVVVQKDVMAIPGVPENGPDRCYHCKLALFQDLQCIATENGFTAVCEGSNMDDNGDYRPGLIAIAELGVKSPLRHVGLYKSEIRELSKELGLPTWKKPAFACRDPGAVQGTGAPHLEEAGLRVPRVPRTLRRTADGRQAGPHRQGGRETRSAGLWEHASPGPQRRRSRPHRTRRGGHPKDHGTRDSRRRG